MLHPHEKEQIMRRVELQLAHSWHCDECSELNFCVPEIPELTDEDREEVFRKLNNVEDYEELPDDWDQFDVLGIPETVTCSKCGSTFEAYEDTGFDINELLDW